MTSQPFTARNVTKFIVQSAVANYTAGLVHTTIIDNTDLEDDNFVVDLGSKVVGWGVASKLKPYTDRAVDKTADFVTSKREARKAKKNAKKDK